MISFDFNPQPVDKALTALQTTLSDFYPALRKIGDDFREMVRDQFASEGRAGGMPWAELAPSTRRRRAGASMLINTGALLRSLEDAGAPGHVEVLDGVSITLGSSLPYALYHQTGAGWGFGQSEPPRAPRRGRGLPMRPLIVLSNDRADAWARVLQAALEERS